MCDILNMSFMTLIMSGSDQNDNSSNLILLKLVVWQIVFLTYYEICQIGHYLCSLTNIRLDQCRVTPNVRDLLPALKGSLRELIEQLSLYLKVKVKVTTVVDGAVVREVAGAGSCRGTTRHSSSRTTTTSSRPTRSSRNCAANSLKPRSATEKLRLR